MAFTITINLGDVSPNITNVQVFTCDTDCNSCVPLSGHENVPVTSFPLQIMGLNDSVNKIKVVALGAECGSLSQCLTINKPTTTQATTTEATTLPSTTEATTQTTTAPLINDIIIERANRGVPYTFSSSDFVNKYSDYDGDPLAEIQLLGDLTGFTFNNNPILTGTWISISNIAGGSLVYTPLDQDAYYEKTINYTAKDINGSISNMATITMKIKNKTSYTLFKNYDSNVMYSNSVTDIKFIQDLNLLQGGLQIRITQLSDKGVLYCNPVGSVGIPVVVNAVITPTQLSNNSLQFKAEGNSNNAFTGSYSTNFKYIVLNSSGVQVGDEVTVTINMTDIPSANIQIINRVIDHQMGSVTFDVVVTGAPFVGYANGLFTNGTVNSDQIVGSIYTPVASMALKITSDRPVGSEDRRSIPVNIPVGTYSGNMEIGANPVPIEEDVSVTLSLSFALTNVYEDGIMGAEITLPYDRAAVVTPE